MKIKSRNLDNFLPRFAGFLVSVLTTLSIFFSTIGYETGLQRRIWIFSAIILIVWTTLLVASSGRKHYKAWEIVTYGFLILAISIYLLNTVWNSGYLTNDPIAAIADPVNRIHRDSLHHAAITEALLNYKIPSLLVNSAAFFDYHFGSHIFMAVLSWIVDIPAYFTYSFFYPAVFLPLYVCLIISISSRAKSFFSKSAKITLWDISFICWFIMPELPLSILSKSAIWKTSWIVSESYLVAIVIALAFLDIAFKFKENEWFSVPAKRYLFHFVLTPVFILLASLSKISVGFLLAAGIVYFYFRKHIKELYYWLLNVFYGILFLAIYFVPGMFDSPFSSANHMTYFELFSFYKHCVTKSFIPIHFIVLYFFSGILLLRCVFQKNVLENIKKGEYVPEEVLLVVCVAGIAPGMILNIVAGSAAYFSYVQQIVALILLIARNLPEAIFALLKRKHLFLKKILVCVVAVCVSGCLLMNSLYTTREFMEMMTRSYSDPELDEGFTEEKQLLEQSKTLESCYLKIVSEINKLTNHRKNDFYLYIDPTATVWEDFSNQLFAVFFYPALTGIVEIGAMYSEDNTVFCNNGEIYADILSYTPTPDDIKMSLDDALEKCKEDGKQALIYIYEDTMEVIQTTNA